MLLAVQGIRTYGKDFSKIAEMIGNKTETQVRTFFMNYRRRYNLDGMLKEFEAKQQEENDSLNIDANGIEQAEPEIMQVFFFIFNMELYCLL